MRTQHFIADLSIEFAGLSDDQVGNAIDVALPRLLSVFRVSQCSIRELDPANGWARLLYSAQEGGMRPLAPSIDYREGFPWSYDMLVMRREPLMLRDLDELPPQAAAERLQLETAGVR